jgi:hypothetical protein
MDSSVRTASCRCGQLNARVAAEPVRVSVCHCLDCQKRTGSAFSAQARWPEDQVTIEGESKIWVHFADSGNKIAHHFCPECGSTVHYSIEGKFDGLIAIPIGAFADSNFPAPKFSVWEERKHDWVDILGEDVEHVA